MASWDKQEGESDNQFHMFATYRDLGPKRTYAKVADITDSSGSYCANLSQQFNWRERVDQWDAHLDRIAQTTIIDEVKARSRKRGRAFETLLDKTILALRQTDLTDVPLNQIAAAMKVASEGMRLEDNLETSRVALDVQDAKSIVGKLPANVRGPLLEALAADIRGRGLSESIGGIPDGMGPGSPFEE